MKLYKAMVKMEGKITFVESEYNTKKDFIDDLRRNGYKVNPNHVKIAELFDYIFENTNLNEWDWKLTLKDIR